MAARHVGAVVLVDPVVRIGAPSAASTAASPPPLATFATLAEAERHFRETEEGEWGGSLHRFVQDIMMHDGESGSWRLPYTRKATSTTGFCLLSRERLRSVREGEGCALAGACVSRRYEQALSAGRRASFASAICIRT
jgi:hypothetical protein